MAERSLTEAAFRRLARLEPFPQPPVLPLRDPVVLMHGFGLLASFRRGGQLHDEAMHLRKRGVRAYAPNVSPYTTIAARADHWEQRLEHVLRETGAERLSLIAHSMGGLDARHLISRRGWHARVHALVTLSTPHHGTAIASFLAEQPDRLQDWIAALVDWMGTRALDGGTANFARAITELTPEHVCKTFNPATPDHPSVRYWSCAGRAGKGTGVPLHPVFRPLNRLLYTREGVNDGYVSVESARWGTFLGAVDLDHARLVGLSRLVGTGDTPEIHTLYRSIVQMLCDEGF